MSTNGGYDPVWSPTDDTLYYFDGTSLVAARVSAASPVFRVLSSSRLFDAPYLFGRIAGSNYGITPDGQRFVMASAPLRPMQIKVVLNWFGELRALAPVK